MASRRPAAAKSSSSGSQPAATRKNLAVAEETAQTTGIEPTEDAVQISPEEIERRVEERTAELARVNEELRGEINARKRAEVSAQEQAQLLELFFRHTLDCVVLLDRDFNFIRVNEAYARACRRDSSEFPGRNHFDLYPSDTREVFEEVVKTKRPHEAVARPFVFADHPEWGVTYWDWTLVPILDGEGEVELLLFSLKDVTEHQQAEHALREEKRLSELLLDSLPHPAMLIRRDRTILAANKTARDAGGKVGGLCWQEFAHAEYIPQQDKQYLCRHGSPPADGTRCTFCLADESLDRRGPTDNPQVHAFGRIWHTHWTPLDDDVYLHYAVDITERIQTESELRQSEFLRAEAEKLTTAGRMTARVAHEIGNPLAGIKAAFGVVKKAIPRDYPRYKHVGRIEKEIDRIQQIVRQMIHLHRAEREVEAAVSIPEILADVVAMLGPVCRERHVSVEIDAESCQPIVKLSENGFRQVLYALLVNGIEASPKGKAVAVTAVANRREVQITVADKGAGVPHEVRDRVFEPFFTTKGAEVTGGLGLGLPIARGIVEAWGGTLDFESQPDQGSVFRIVLPRGDADESSDIAPPRTNPDRG